MEARREARGATAGDPSPPRPSGRQRSRQRSHWGWGLAEREPGRASLEALAPLVHERLGFGGERIEEPVPLEAVEIAPARLKPPVEADGLFHGDDEDRIRHAMGRSYRDVVRGFRGRYDRTPDLVAYPESEQDLQRVLEVCEARRLAIVPFGGGTSVVGGVEPDVGHGYRGVVSLDLGGLSGVIEVDEVSNAALVRAGTTGPDLEAELRPHDLTLRHFPQSFEFSTLGGWLATRAGGHFATAETHIDDLVESIRALTPSGPWESRRLPGSGAGPSPDGLLLGSEGALGVITEAWMRVRPRPTHKAGRSIRFESFAAGAEAVRAIAQSRLDPANCRLLDPLEAEINGAGQTSSPSSAVLVIGFESAFAPVEPQLELAVECALDHGGQAEEKTEGESDAAGRWRSAFLSAPYLRDSLVCLGVLSETFETAITWDRFPGFHSQVIEAARRAVAESIGGPGEGAGAPLVSCRLTHVYPDGAAPYFTVLAPARHGSEVEQWDLIKAAVSEAIIAAGGTITHHHAVGRDHRQWYELQRPEPFAAALEAAKQVVDPQRLMNPGVLGLG